MCDAIINPAYSASTNGSANVISTVPTNFHHKVRYKMDCYILHIVLLVIILLFIMALFCYHYVKHKVKTKKDIVVLTI